MAQSQTQWLVSSLCPIQNDDDIQWSERTAEFNHNRCEEWIWILLFVVFCFLVGCLRAAEPNSNFPFFHLFHLKYYKGPGLSEGRGGKVRRNYIIFLLSINRLDVTSQNCSATHCSEIIFLEKTHHSVLQEYSLVVIEWISQLVQTPISIACINELIFSINTGHPLDWEQDLPAAFTIG